LKTKLISELKIKYIYLYFYTDSIGFPRGNQSPAITFPFLLTEILEKNLNLKVYTYIRGMGGGRITEIKKIFDRDRGYLKPEDQDSIAFSIFNVGIVDAAPRPFTYHLRQLAKVPIIGGLFWAYISKILNKYTTAIHKVYSFNLTTPAKFRSSFNRMVVQSLADGIKSISIDTPLTPMILEYRAPGLRKSIDFYNSIKHLNTSALHIRTDWVKDQHYVADGHHLNDLGHIKLAEQLYKCIESVLID
jgi:hypothetical protein